MAYVYICSACPVWKGECPECGTFWWITPADKRVGLRPLDPRLNAQPGASWLSRGVYSLAQMPNYVEDDRAWEAPK